MGVPVFQHAFTVQRLGCANVDEVREISRGIHGVRDVLEIPRVFVDFRCGQAAIRAAPCISTSDLQRTDGGHPHDLRGRCKPRGAAARPTSNQLR